MINPILMYFDQFLIGTLISLAAVGYYAPPFSIASKLVILPGCLVTALFPAFSAYAGRGDLAWIEKKLIRSLKFVILIVGPAALLLAFFARPVLTLWLGTRFAQEGAPVLQILCGGLLINALAYIPYSLVQGVGRPDLTAKFHVAELPVHVALAWFLIGRMGLRGAALAWTARISLDLVLLLGAACWVTSTSPRTLAGRELGRSLATLALLGGGLYLLCSLSLALLSGAVCAGILSSVFLAGAWRYVLSFEERDQIKLLFGPLRLNWRAP